MTALTLNFSFSGWYLVILFRLADCVKLEDLKVLRRSLDLLNNVKIGLGQLQLIMEQILFLPYTFWSSNLNNLMNYPSNSPVISEKKMFRQVCGSPNEWPWIKGHRSA